MPTFREVIESRRAGQYQGSIRSERGARQVAARGARGLRPWTVFKIFCLRLTGTQWLIDQASGATPRLGAFSPIAPADEAWHLAWIPRHSQSQTVSPSIADPR